jgi:hypothetical protein
LRRPFTRYFLFPASIVLVLAGSFLAKHIVIVSTNDPAHMDNLNFDPSNSACANNPFACPFTVTCGVGFGEGSHQGNQETQSITEDSSVDYCNWLKDRGSRNYESSLYKRSYDTLKLYIERCPNQDGSFHEFTLISSSAQYMSNDNDRWLEYRDWLKKVLYLNMDTLYYCADAKAMLVSFQYLRPGQGEDYNGEVALIDYLLENNRCPDDSSYLVKSRNYVRESQLFIWRDTVKDSTLTPIDTSLLNIDDLGLKILRGPQYAVVPSASMGKSGIVSLRAERNPFTDEVALVYRIETTELVKLEVFDALGNKIYKEPGGFAQQGERRFDLKTSSWASGVYYARISTYSGEVKTVKLIKE